MEFLKQGWSFGNIGMYGDYIRVMKVTRKGSLRVMLGTSNNAELLRVRRLTQL